MSRMYCRPDEDSETVRPSAISGLRARLATLDFVDWCVILLMITGLIVAIYTTSLRHP